MTTARPGSAVTPFPSPSPPPPPPPPPSSTSPAVVREPASLPRLTIPTLPSQASVRSTASATPFQPDQSDGGHGPGNLSAGGMTPAQAAAVEAALVAGTSSNRPIRRSRARRLVPVIILALLAAAIGAGSRYVWDRQSDAAPSLPAFGNGLPTIDFVRPEGTYTDISFTVEQDGATYLHRARRNLTAEEIDVAIVSLDTDEPTTVIRVRNGRSSQQWAQTPRQPVVDFDLATSPLRRLIEDGAGLVYMIDEIAPVEMLPFVVDLVEQDTTLAVSPIGAADDPDDEDLSIGTNPRLAEQIVTAPPLPGEILGEVGIVGPAPAPLPVRHYRFTVDMDAFALAEPLAHARVVALGLGTDGRWSVWVDESGVVRQIDFSDSDSVAIRLNAIDTTLTGFDTPVWDTDIPLPTELRS